MNSLTNIARSEPLVPFHPSLPWLIWACSAIFVVFQFMIQLSSGVIVQQLMLDFSISGFWAGILSSSYYYIYATLQTPAGILIDRFGPRLLLSYGAVICGIGCLVFGTTHDFLIALVARLAMGGGAAFAFVGSLYLIREWFKQERYAMMVGLAETLGMIGSIVGTISLAALLDYFGWRHCMLISGGFAILLSGILWLVIQNHNPLRTNISATDSKTAFFRKLLTVIRNPVAWLNAIYLGVIFSVVIVFAALWGILFFELKLDASLTEVTAVDTMIFLGAAIGCPIFGHISEKWQQRRNLMVYSTIGTLVLLVLIIYLPYHSIIVASILMTLLGVCCSGYIITYAVSDDIAPHNMKNTYTGFTNTIGVSGAPLFQPLIGYLLDHQARHHPGHYLLHDYEVAFSSLIVILVIALILVLLMPETYTKNK